MSVINLVSEEPGALQLYACTRIPQCIVSGDESKAQSGIPRSRSRHHRRRHRRTSLVLGQRFNPQPTDRGGTA